MDRVTSCLLLLALLVAATTALLCAPCDDTTCVPPPPGCELGQRVCACCHECRVREGQECGAFTPECESDLVCYTSEGVFVGRPPWDSRASGKCIKYADVPGASTPGPRIGRSIFRRRK